MAYSKVILNGTTLIDVTQKTVTASTLLQGETALKNDGTDVTGTYVPQTCVLQSKTVSPSTSQQTVSPDLGYDGLSSVTVNAMPSGSASTPATSITANPTISVSSSGLITASVSGSQSVTPSVSAGYVSSGTAGTITVSGSNTSQLSTQSAQTITPTTTNQTIASGKYLTGVQTILGDVNLIAENIKKDISLFNIIGTYEGSGGGGQDDMDIVVKCNGNTFTNNASDYTFEVGSFVELLNKVMNGDKVCGIAYCREDYYDDEEDCTNRANWSILYLQNASLSDYGGYWGNGSITFSNIQPAVGASDRLVLKARSLIITGNDDPEMTKSFIFNSLQKTIN